MSPDFPKYPRIKKPQAPVRGNWKTLIRAHSPYLSGLLPEELPGPPDAQLEKLLKLPKKPASTEDLMRMLRDAKKKIAFLCASCDLKGEWDDLKVMRALSLFADFCVKECLSHLLVRAHTEKKIKLKDLKNPEKGCGIAVVALGKWGAFELNYSSDIDLMVIFDREKSAVKDKDETQAFFTRLTRDLADMLERPEDNGYVFRTDLRLRPDPGSMPLAVSIAAAEAYYGSLGQNWERAAMIKARPVAGDGGVAGEFMEIMRAWIWRRNLDFAAIQDINSIKRQINAKYAHKEKASNSFLNYNVKLGHGGIREIEFFAQTQQLIYGGRDPSLRAPDTLGALAALAQAGHIDAKMQKNLADAYLFLRRVEHRLQMRDDRQTHTLPNAPAGFADIAGFLEYKDTASLVADLEKHTGHVKKLYAGLFTESPSLSGPGNLVFTGVEDDPETLATIRGMGFGEPEKITAAIRGWHHGRYRAVRSERARQILTELTPHLLVTLSKTPHPDEAFIRFDMFLSRLPAGIPIFSMFAHNPQQMELVAGIMGASPVMADFLGAHPEALEGVLSKDFFGGLPDLARLEKELRGLLEAAQDYQDVLDITRRFAREKRFHAGIHILKNLSPDQACGRYLSDVAEACLLCLVPHVEKDFARQHGVFKTGEFIILAMGSFAARRMFSDSDLDIVGLYRASGKEEASKGAKPLPPNVYYIRLMQRLIAALSAPTAEGVLYEADARLRPSGDSGPLAASLDGFFAYQKKDAWVWEHMSLIRSRPVYARPATAKLIAAERLKILAAKRDGNALKKEMLEMRSKVEKEFGSKDPWRLKYARGGVMDVMFAAHFLALKDGGKNLFHPDVRICLERLHTEQLLSARDFRDLARAQDTALAVTGFLHLCAELPFRPDTASEGLKKALVQRGGKKMSFGKFEDGIAKECRESYAVFRKIFA